MPADVHRAGTGGGRFIFGVGWNAHDAAPGGLESGVGHSRAVGCCGIFSGIPAAICGHKAQAKIKASNGTLDGAGMALAGLILGYVAIGLTVVLIPIYSAIAIPSFMSAREAARKANCNNNLRLIDHAKQQFATSHANVTDSYAPTWSELQPYFKAGSPQCPDGGTYSVNAITSNPTCSKSGHVLVNDFK